ncbi:putative ABC transport system permease protein [Chitinophaga eiseniae]|uniref:Putative ABC transport system permease protein n=1 Tax=Chitinophaga eiseniae TaxID=634771 RepID=A0A1T4TZF4_9BACT|nr:ABC transporter permease [Chitinophaga eiseniae]SKA45790.1 putative ABC transport system permease protein [Chitinophaga eiseniae]
MIRNYFKIAVRNLARSKGYAAINIFGLAVALATCLLITLFVIDELSYDRYNQKADRIYRVNADFLVNGNAFRERYTPAQLGATMRKDFPGIENYVRFRGFGDRSVLIKKGNETLMEHNAGFADSTLFDVFTLPMLAGDPKTALTKPYTMVISEKMAGKYFGSTAAAVGKTLHINNTDDYMVTGVIKDVPAASHMHFDIIKSMASLEDSRNTAWMADNYDTYLLVRPGINEATLLSQLKTLTKTYMDGPLKAMIGSSIEELERSNGHFRYDVLPLTKIHLYSPFTNEVEPGGNIQYVYIFTIVAVFILLIACVNFMNLSTARSAGRSREVGVRKALGSQRSNLITQFLTESMLTTTIAALIAVAVALLLLPYLNQVAGKAITPDVLLSKWLLLGMLTTIFVVGLLAGSYPAFFLSSFEPVQVLKGKLATGFRGGWLRNSLVVFQFSTAVILIVGTLVIYSQLNYIRNKKLGYSREQVVVLKNTQSLWAHAEAFKEEVLKLPGVQAGTMADALPVSTIMNTSIFAKDAAASAGQVMGLFEWRVDADYLHTLGMQMAAGRNFSPAMPSDSNTLLINETAAKLLGYSDLNDRFLYSNAEGNRPLRIIGIVKDFNSGSLRTKIPPIVLHLAKRPDMMAFRIRTGDIPALLSKIEDKYHSVAGMEGQPFLYTFLDDDFSRLYAADQRTGKIFVSFTCFAILISCLGLFGLVTYAAEQRTKEISIRKVMGASVTSIVTLLSRDFLKLVAVAIVVASPLAWWIMDRWLQDFAYRISIGWWVFAATALLAVLITLVTICLQAIKAARANPVVALR